MHPKIEAAIEEIDAAVMNGDTFEDVEAREELLEVIERWRRELYRPDGLEPMEGED